MLSTTFKVKLPNPQNRHESHLAKSGRAAKQREMARLRIANLIHAKRLELKPPFVVTMIRIGRQKMDAHDGLRASMKHLVDGVQDALGIDDGDENKISWLYAQEPGKESAVRIEITWQ